MMDEEEEEMMVGPKGMKIQWGEFMTVIIQALHSLGYSHTAGLLEKESDISYIHQPTKFESLRTQFLNGFWEKCAKTLCTIEGLDQETVGDAMFLIFRIWLLESLALNRSLPISKVLQNEHANRLSPGDNERLAKIVAGFHAMNDYGYIDALNELSCVVELRKLIWKQLEDCLPPAVAMSDNRLLALVEFGLSAQIDSCLSHNMEDVISLYQDHLCGKDQLPTTTMQILIGHYDSVWYVKFSHNGQYLASASADYTVIIWEVSAGWDVRRRYVLRGHNSPNISLSWSPNDELLLTCAYGDRLMIWDVQTGVCTHESSEGVEVHSSCAFLMSDQIDFVYATLRPPISVHLLRNVGDFEIVSISRTGGRMIKNFAVTPNGSKLVIICPDSEAKIIVHHIHTGDCDTIGLQEKTYICGFSVSEDSESLILNLSNREIQVWDLNRIKARPLIYSGYTLSEYSTHSCFGGVESAFLASGSQDSKVYIWNRRKSKPIEVLSGHSSPVRCVTWNPLRPQMLASASDDGTIRLWGPQRQEVDDHVKHDNGVPPSRAIIRMSVSLQILISSYLEKKPYTERYVHR